MAGWIKLHRCLLDKAIWQLNDAQVRVFITVLLMANREEKQWLWKGNKFKAEPGQFVTSIGNLAKTARVSRQSVRTGLDNMRKLDFLTYESTKTGILVTVTNWGLYQSKQNESTNESTDSQPTVNQQSTTNKNHKNHKKERIKEDISSSSEPKVRKSVDKFSSLTETHMKLAKWLEKQILNWKPDAKLPHDLRPWANEMRLMMEQDDRTEEQIVYVIDYLVTDTFWRVNVMSAATLRKQFDRLEAKMRGQSK